MAADRNLLFGLLALQNGMIDQSKLVAAFQAWTLEKDRPLADHLVGRGELEPEQRAIVEALVALHVKKHGDSAERSLAAIPARPLGPRQPGAARRPRDRSQPGRISALGPRERLARPLAQTGDRGTRRPSTTGRDGDERAGPSRRSDRAALADRAARYGQRGRCTDVHRGSTVRWSESTMGSRPRPADIGCSARSPAAGWARCSGAATRPRPRPGYEGPPGPAPRTGPT